MYVTKYEHTCTWLMIVYNMLLQLNWELFKRSLTHGVMTYTDELTQVGHYLAIANP